MVRASGLSSLFPLSCRLTGPIAPVGPVVSCCPARREYDGSEYTARPSPCRLTGFVEWRKDDSGAESRRHRVRLGNARQSRHYWRLPPVPTGEAVSGAGKSFTRSIGPSLAPRSIAKAGPSPLEVLVPLPLAPLRCMLAKLPAGVFLSWRVTSSFEADCRVRGGAGEWFWELGLVRRTIARTCRKGLEKYWALGVGWQEATRGAGTVSDGWKTANKSGEADSYQRVRKVVRSRVEG